MQEKSFIFYIVIIASLSILLTGCPENDLPSVGINGQVWTIQNYDGTHYQNGDIIPEIKSPAEWEKLTTGAWCYYNNDESNGTKYQKLYNIFAINDKRGFAPKGWHIPSNTEWIKLVDFLGGASVAASAMKSTRGWNGSGNGTNISKLNCLPGGIRSSLSFSGVGDLGIWWTSSKDASDYGIIWVVNAASVDQNNAVNNSGVSVRLIKDKE
jgi:uncharacterized protein (TIGR02145 family)